MKKQTEITNATRKAIFDAFWIDINFQNKLKEQMRLRFIGLSASRYPSLTSEYMFNYIFSCLLSNLNFWYEHQKECSLEQICSMSKQLVSEGMLKYIENMDI